MTGQERSIACLRLVAPPHQPDAQQPSYPLSLSESLWLGRDPRCQIVLDPVIYRAVSRRHAEISPVLGFESPDGARFWQICDLNSANGTFLNGQRLQGCQVLQAGDRVMLGQDGPEFVFEYQWQPVESVPAATSHPSTSSPPPIRGINLPAVSSVTPRPRPVQAYRSKRPVAASQADSISWTQLFPIFSTGQDLTRKAYLLPGGITVAFVVLMFLAVGSPLLFNLLLASYLSGAAYYFVYQLCGKRKPWWVLVSAAVMTVLLLTLPTLNLFILVFRVLLPGEIPTAQVPFPLLLVRMFFGAGLMEELLKAVPVLVLLWWGRQLRQPARERIGVWEPLDGILLGTASAVGFTLVETLGQYLPDIYHSTLAAGEGVAQLASLQLLIPRVLGSVSGHMAYSGYLGYFIGLSVLRPRKRWLILGVGYLTAAGLHTLWNAAGVLSPVLLAVVGVLSYAFLGAAILKARELSPTRSQNFATRFYR